MKKIINLKKSIVFIFTVLFFANCVLADEAPVNADKEFDIANGFYISGCQKLEKLDFNGALADFNKSIQHVPSPQAYLNRGFIKDELGDYDGAIKDYTYSIEAAGDNEEIQAEGYYNRALANESKQNFKAALSDYDTAISLNPNYSDYYAQRAILKSKLKEFQSGALSDIEKAISLEPTHPGYKSIKNEIIRIVPGAGVQKVEKTSYQTENSNNAVKSSNVANPANTLNTAYSNQDKTVTSTPVKQTKVIAENDYAALATESRLAKKYGLAIDYYGKAITNNPFSKENAEFYYYRGECYRNLGNIRAARKDYDQAVLLDPEIKKLRNYLR